jgi:hypothetical protein
MSNIDRLLDEAEKAQRKGHLLLAEVCRDAADELGLVIEERNQLKELIAEWKEEPVGGISKFGVVYLSPERVAAIVDPLKESHERGMIALEKALARLMVVEALRIDLEAERDQMREAVEDLMTADDYWLRGNKDNQWRLMLVSARAKARAALGRPE